MMSIIMVRCHGVRIHGNGIVGLEIETVPISDEDNKVLSKLFPHCERQVYELLETEALLSSITNEVPAAKPEQPIKVFDAHTGSMKRPS